MLTCTSDKVAPQLCWSANAAVLDRSVSRFGGLALYSERALLDSGRNYIFNFDLITSDL